MALQGKRVLLIANPAAQNGKAARAVERAAGLLRAGLGEGALDVVLTKSAGHAESEAARAGAMGEYDVVVALGGDGIIHEVANGLLSVPAAGSARCEGHATRPVLGVIPVGSGNDYAHTLGMDARSVDKAVSQLLAARPQRFDVGLVNGRYFVETLSFGLDAAIALDTVDRRKRTGKTGTALYLESGIDQLLHHLDCRHYHAALDGGSLAASREIEGDSYIFAVQIGQTYGGGFRICPDARTDDGLFDVCIAHPPLGPLYATFIFLLAKNAHHTRFKQLEFLRARSLKLAFDAPLPAQIDGERIEAETYDITCIPQALEVLVP